MSTEDLVDDTAETNDTSPITEQQETAAPEPAPPVESGLATLDKELDELLAAEADSGTLPIVPESITPLTVKEAVDALIKALGKEPWEVRILELTNGGAIRLYQQNGAKRTQKFEGWAIVPPQANAD